MPIFTTVQASTAGYIGVPDVVGGSNWIEHFLEPSFMTPAFEGASGTDAAAPAASHSLEITLIVVSSILALAGIAIAARLYLRRPEIPARLAAGFPGVYRFLVNKGYVDEVFEDAV